MTSIKIMKFDFSPKSGGNFDINWPGPPRRQLKYSDVKHYIPIIELESQSPIGFTLIIAVREYRESLGIDELMSDVDLTDLRVRFEAGNRTPSEIRMVNHIAGPPKDPDGSPQYTFGSFWLGISKAGKIRGNVGTGDDGHALVYMELAVTFWLPDVRGYELKGKMKSPKHKVKAI